jgi:hypothetical protein
MKRRSTLSRFSSPTNNGCRLFDDSRSDLYQPAPSSSSGAQAGRPVGSNMATVMVCGRGYLIRLRLDSRTKTVLDYRIEPTTFTRMYTPIGKRFVEARNHGRPSSPSQEDGHEQR